MQRNIMENEEHNSRVVYDLLELAVGAQSRADYAQLQVNDIVGTAVRAGATWEQVGRWLHLAPDEAEVRFSGADRSITLDEDVVIALGYIAKVEGLPTFADAISYLINTMIDKSAPASDSAPSVVQESDAPTEHQGR